MGRFYILILVAGLAGSARAEFNNFDPHRMADVSGKTVNMPVLKYDSIPQPVLNQGTAPASSKTVERGNVIQNKNVDTETLSFPNVESKTVPRGEVLEKTTIERKASVETSVAPGQKVLPQSNADTNKRVIPMMTPAGQEEMKNEFRK